LISNDNTIDEEKRERWLRKYHNIKCNELDYSNLFLEEIIK
jgi:hypothetical protein